MSLALRLTLLMLLLRPVGTGWLRPSILSLAAAGLVLPGVLRHPALWLALAGLVAWRVLAGWPLADNHAYLLVYWCLAIALAVLAPRFPASLACGSLRGTRPVDPGDRGGPCSISERALAWNGRALVGLAFAFAVLGKLLSPDYLDGRFFRVTLLADPRLEPLALWAGGLDEATLEERRTFLTQHVDGPALARRAPPEPERLRRLALGATWLTLALEAAVALAFLAPLGRHVWLRHALLLLFCATTYAIAPVASFGWLLLAMGTSQCERDARRTRLAYLGAFALLIFYARAPWLRGA